MWNRFVQIQLPRYGMQTGDHLNCHQSFSCSVFRSLATRCSQAARSSQPAGASLWLVRQPSRATVPWQEFNCSIWEQFSSVISINFLSLHLHRSRSYATWRALRVTFFCTRRVKCGIELHNEQSLLTAHKGERGSQWFLLSPSVGGLFIEEILSHVFLLIWEHTWTRLFILNINRKVTKPTQFTI